MLDELAIKILRFLSKYESVPSDQLCANFGQDIIKTHISFLVENQYIKGTTTSYPVQNYSSKEIKEIPFTVGPYRITPKGRAFLESLEKQKEQADTEQNRYNEEKRRSWTQFWTPLIVSTLISLSALVVSILAYIKQ